MLRIRAREPDDAEAITEILNCPSVYAGTLQLPLRSLAERRARMDQPAADVHHLVAELDGRVVGSLSVHVEANPRRRHCGGIGMAVHEDFQGQGVGTALL
ncbi:MAG TPA: GNAT family N-acetyltransferase, partial [Ktedonobacterales bacterium]